MHTGFVKTIRVPLQLRDQINKIISGDNTVWKKCPVGHDVRVEIKIRYVKACSGPQISFTGNVPVKLQNDIERVISSSRTVQANCPFEHNAKVEIKIEYIRVNPKLDTSITIYREKVLGPKMIISEVDFVSEHFELLLEQLLSQEQKRFVKFFRNRNNFQCSPIEWMREGFTQTIYRGINSLCVRKRLCIVFAKTECFHNIGISERLAKYRFFVTKPARAQR